MSHSCLDAFAGHGISEVAGDVEEVNGSLALTINDDSNGKTKLSNE